MALFNYANREITAKVVYYGPGVCGKTTSLQYIHERIDPSQRGRLLSLATETDRTIFFDLLPLKLGEIGGFKLRFQLYTVPGQVKYNKTRKLVLQGADAVVFVADSQVNRRDANIASFKNLQENLVEQRRRIEELPLVYEFNKRDMKDVLSIEDLNRELNPRNLPFFSAVATKGVGVMETLEAISKMTLKDMEQRLRSNSAPVEEEADEDLLFSESELVDLTGAGGGNDLSFSTEELDALELESDLSNEGADAKGLETKPIGYGRNVAVEEIVIQDEEVAHTGTLKESAFFELKEIEEQALRELDDFLEGKDDLDDDMSFALMEAEETANGSEAGAEFTFDAESRDESAGGAFDADSVSSRQQDDLTFGTDETDDEPGLDFSLGNESDENGFSFSFDEKTERPAKSGEKAAAFDFGADDLAIGGEETEADADQFPEFQIDDFEDRTRKSSPGVDDDDLISFSLDEDVKEAANQKIENLELDENDLDFSFGQDEADSEDTSFTNLSGQEWPLQDSSEFRITDSVRFEMQVGEDISTVTPFEQQLDELSEDAFTTSAEREKADDEFQPEVAEETDEEQFQMISDEWTRLVVLAKFFYQRGEALRAQHTTRDNIQAVIMYYTATETALKAVSSKYETCNPGLASFHLLLESIEEETEKQVAGTKSLRDNIVLMKNRIQLEAQYPDDEECELAARICERFLSSLAHDFLTIDFAKLSPVLARSEHSDL